jgi:hypothetical protein
MIWHDDAHYCRSFADGGYLLTWTYHPHGPFYRAWAKRQEGQRRGKLLSSGYSRADAERACREHYAKNVSRLSVEQEARP